MKTVNDRGIDSDNNSRIKLMGSALLLILLGM